MSYLLVVRGVSPGCRLFGTASVVESFSVEFLYLKMTNLYKRFTVCCLAFARCMGLFLNKGIIMCGVAVTLCITMTAFSVSVRLCCAGVKSCLRGLSAVWEGGTIN